MRRVLIWFLVCGVPLWGLPLMASDEPLFESQIEHDGVTLKQVGQSRLNFLWMTAYDAVLWAPGGVYDFDKPHAVELLYDMNFTQDELVDESIKQLKKMPGVNNAQLGRWREALNALSLAVVPGDRVRMIAVPEKAITFYKNGTLLNRIRDAELSRYYLQIWLREGSDYPTVTRQLMGVSS